VSKYGDWQVWILKTVESGPGFGLAIGWTGIESVVYLAVVVKDADYLSGLSDVPSVLFWKETAFT